MSEASVEQQAEAIVGEVVGKEEVVFATADRVELTSEEKLSVSRLEVEFLRSQSEITRLQGVMSAAQARFPQVIDSLVRKYSINPVTHVFDNLELTFKRK